MHLYLDLVDTHSAGTRLDYATTNAWLYIKKSDYFRHAKPLTCHVHLSIFPPQYSLDPEPYNQHYPRIFLGGIREYDWHIRVLSTIPSINIVPLHRKTLTNLKTEYQHDDNWMKGAGTSHLSKLIGHDTFVICRIDIFPTEGSSSGLEGFIKTILVLRYCSSCRTEGSNTEAEIGRLDRPSVEKYAFPRLGWSHLWDICSFASEKSLATEMLKQSCNCQKRPAYIFVHRVTKCLRYICLDWNYFGNFIDSNSNAVTALTNHLGW